MFEKKDPFDWKPPLLILTGVVVLSGGIYLGIKTTNIEDKQVNVEHKTEQQVEKSKEVFELSKDCEIWVHKKNEDGSDSGKSPMMIGTIDKVLLDKSEDEIVAYLKDKYPDREIESLGKYEIVLSEVKPTNDPSKSNKYSLEEDEEFIGLYRYDSNGNRELVEKTQIRIDSLPKKVQEEVQKGIIVNSEDEAYIKLENFGS
ncbi:hypothetical protein [Romboutsia sp.]|uniref:hypothetical protein n=1 Tax=Romboutsia sp. TaxID=1965302 RepID=UPI002C04812A|nr:hypothetical protein [Romboutsia sp.]HSQ90372.1 hypothetical protein [Romboutsia sp.]